MWVNHTRIISWLAMVLASVRVAGAAEQGIAWQPTIEVARRLAAQTNRLVLIHFWSESCQPCLSMEHEVFSRSDSAGALEGFYVPVKINVSQFPFKAREFGVTRLPTDVVLTPDGKEVQRYTGAASREQYLGRLNQLATSMRMRSVPPYAEIARRSPASDPRGMVAPTAQEPPAGRAPQGPPTSIGWAGPPATGQAGTAGNSVPFGSAAPPLSAAPPVSAAPPASAAPPITAAPPIAAAPPSAAPANPAPQGYAVPPWHQAAAAGQPTPTSFRPEKPPLSPPGASLGSQALGPTSSVAGPRAVPPGNPPLAIDGFCAVTLALKEKWTKGDPRFGVIHRGRTYLFVGPDEAAQFYNDPDRFAPALSGNDPVQAAEGRMVEGRREFGLWYEGRVYLFADAETRARFEREAARYARWVGEIMAAATPRKDAPSAGAPAPNGPSVPGAMGRSAG